MVEHNWINEKYKLNELNEILSKCEEQLERVVNSGEIKDESNITTFLLYSVGKSIVSAREAMVLCQSGFPDGALSISRNVFEQFITVAYMESKMDSDDIGLLIDKYNDDYTYQRAKALRFEAEYITGNKDDYKKYDDEIVSMKTKYGIGSIKDYWWTIENGMDFSRLCDYVANDNGEMSRFIRLMQLLYKRACLSLHASNMGNRIRLGSDAQYIDIGPWDSGQENALFLLTTSLIYIFAMTFYTLEIKCDELIEQMNDLALYYQVIIGGCDKGKWS